MTVLVRRYQSDLYAEYQTVPVALWGALAERCVECGAPLPEGAVALFAYPSTTTPGDTYVAGACLVCAPTLAQRVRWALVPTRARLVCHPECGPRTDEGEGEHGHTNVDGRCWHDNSDVPSEPVELDEGWPLLTETELRAIYGDR